MEDSSSSEEVDESDVEESLPSSVSVESNVSFDDFEIADPFRDSSVNVPSYDDADDLFDRFEAADPILDIFSTHCLSVSTEAADLLDFCDDLFRDFFLFSSLSTKEDDLVDLFDFNEPLRDFLII